VRVQSGYAYSTIYAWATVARVSEVGHPEVLVTEAYRVLAGCAHMSKEEYIFQYCSKWVGKKSRRRRVVCDGMVSVFFACLWTREGKAIKRMVV
jgi:hypothetical protein